MERLDIFLARRGDYASRTKAAEAIAEGQVTVNGVPADKPSLKISEDDRVETVRLKQYVGRGAYKLLGAIRAFNVDPSGRNALDVGASTGGFTQVLLEHGAAHVYALDVGEGQLAAILRNSDRVTDWQKTDIRKLTPQQVEGVSLITVDVSFISLTYILGAPAVREIMAAGGEMIALIKPQFEAGRAAADKHGVVRKPADHVKAIEKIADSARTLGYAVGNLIPSPITGGDGNREYLIHLGRESVPVLAEAVVADAFAQS